MSPTARHAHTGSGQAGSDQARPGRRRRLVLVAVVATAAVLGGGVLTLNGATSAVSPCSRSLVVLASPDIAPVVRSVAEQLPGAGGSCAPFRVRAEDSATVLAGLRSGRGPGVDIWLPDSSWWLQRAGRVDSSTGSIAHSPVVLAASPALGSRITAAGSAAGIAAVAPRDGRRPVRIVLTSPRRSARTSAALVGLQTALAPRADARRVLAGLLAAADVRSSGDRPAGPSALAPGSATPASEQQVFTLNTGRATAGVVALYSGGRGSVLDYPFAVLAASPARQARAERLLAALHEVAGQSAIRAAGFRDGRGRAGDALAGTLGLDARRPGTSPALRPVDAAAAAAGLAAVRQPAHLLAVLDVSGSMASPVPGAGSTRMGLVLRAAANGLTLYPDRNSVGLWTFSTHQDGRLDYRRLLSPARLGPAGDPSGGRARLAAALKQIRPTDGDTGLYDTTLAAVRAQLRSWQPGHTNAVLLLTDGRNADPSGIGLPDLLRTLRSEQDPARPVPVISIAYGSDPGAAASLRRISATTGGTAYTARPQEIGQVLLDALGQRSCRPLCSADPVPGGVR